MVGKLLISNFAVRVVIPLNVKREGKRVEEDKEEDDEDEEEA